ncbi:MAG: putative ABC transport system permease protein [Chloroflexi bacterium]|jgi:putative ABC transport system permease protein|nr:MAG: putative ABC transport system permease protein [Chloroflexota bacterium]
MKILTIFRTALSSLGANKLRAGLTVLGIVIGVAAVISLMAIGRGAQDSITSRIESLGANLLFVSPDSTSEETTSTLTLEDSYALIDQTFAPHIAAVAPELTAFGQVEAGRDNTRTRVVGVTPDYLGVRNFDIGTGQFISQMHVDKRSEVVVLGSQVSKTLFGLRNPVGQSVRINGRQFSIIGVLESRGGSALGNQDNQVLVPITTAYYRLGSQRTVQGEVSVQSISVQATDGDAIDNAVQEIAMVLRLRHRIIGEDDFTITSQEDTIEALEETTGTFIVFLGAIASISLIVGGIGIMNIMLVTVTERTREIGIRKAMGAKRRDILVQFVSEATLLSLGGGLVGAIFGLALSRFLDGRNLIGQTFQTSFSGDIAILALVVSGAIGLFFGIYPAVRAARMHPIEALRYE